MERKWTIQIVYFRSLDLSLLTKGVTPDLHSSHFKHLELLISLPLVSRVRTENHAAPQSYATGSKVICRRIPISKKANSKIKNHNYFKDLQSVLSDICGRVDSMESAYSIFRMGKSIKTMICPPFVQSISKLANVCAKPVFPKKDINLRSDSYHLFPRNKSEI